ncbi:hypothetical protein RQM65_02370 [Pricia sp. S334]|uniref:Uncharacterized protein n=1 Tax=Pricia mediterranea TaxID=3076079 RepID=A0ABU3L1Q3_9FLAO|nr:hypothetical protein [Pricia sp. S334]MDT7827508.1 hypothetical protein [Pricia sp. S334]
MERTKIIMAHIVATAVGTLTISCFFIFSLIVEIMGETLFIKQVKTGILCCLPILFIAMPVFGLTGKKLAGNSKNPLVLHKLRRMKLVALNGAILISLDTYLYYHAI